MNDKCSCGSRPIHKCVKESGTGYGKACFKEQEKLISPETIYEVYSQIPGEPIHTLWLCKSKDTANMLRDWEEASEVDTWYNFSKIAKDWSWESFKLSHGQHFKVAENYLYE